MQQFFFCLVPPGPLFICVFKTQIKRGPGGTRLLTLAIASLIVRWIKDSLCLFWLRLQLQANYQVPCCLWSIYLLTTAKEVFEEVTSRKKMPSTQ